jgi:hypothetical protein
VGNITLTKKAQGPAKSQRVLMDHAKVVVMARGKWGIHPLKGVSRNID